jgi:hypothetical protein
MQERGEVNLDDERNLDDDVPDADVTQQTINTEATGLEGEDAEADLDDDIPEASDGDDLDDEDGDGEGASQTSGFAEGWTYDTRREPDSEDDFRPPRPLDFGAVPVSQMPRRYVSPGAYDESDGVGVDEREARELANAMLDEDELGEMEEGDRDLDEDVPDADEGSWEHTDTEEEDESEMDISILPGPGAPAMGIEASSRRAHFADAPATGMRGARVVSGNAARLQMQTPTAGDIDALLGSSSVPAVSEMDSSVPEQQQQRRNWLSPSSARRNLFGVSRLGRGTAAGGSGGLFTPSPRQESEETDQDHEMEGQPSGQGHRRRRSGRLLGIGGRRRENRDSVD